MWVRFLRRYSWRPPEYRSKLAIAFPAGMVRFVRRCCAEEALAAGAAERVPRPERR